MGAANTSDFEARLAKLESEVSALRQARRTERVDQAVLNLAAGGTVAAVSFFLSVLSGEAMVSSLLTGLVSYLIGFGFYVAIVRHRAVRRGRFGNLAARLTCYEGKPGE